MNEFGRKGLSLERLEAFVQVAEAGGIARAAPDAPVRQSQFSRQISELEASLGCELLERAGRRRRPTEAGRRLLQLVRELRAGLVDVTADGTMGPLKVRLGAGDSILHWVVLPGIATLPTLNGRRLLELKALSSEDIAAQVLESELDFGVLRVEAVRGELRTQRLGRLTYAGFVSRKLCEKLLPWQELLQTYPLALATGERGLQQAFDELGTKPALCCETFPQAARAAEAGHHVAILPVLASQQLSPARFRRIHLPPLETLGQTLVLAWRPRLDEIRPLLKPLRSPLASLLRGALPT